MHHEVSEAVSFTSIALLIVLAVFATYKLAKLAEWSEYAPKRKLSVAICCLVICAMLALPVSHIYTHGVHFIVHWNVEHTRQLAFVSAVVFDATWCAVFAVLNHKIWMVYFEHNFSLHISTLEWKRHLNPAAVEPLLQTNWYLANRSRWGNGRVVALVSAGAHMLLWVASVLMALLATSFASVWLSLCWLDELAGVFFVAMHNKTPNFEDVFRVQYENRLFARVVWVLLVLRPAYSLALAFDSLTAELVLLVAVELSLCAMVLVSTVPVLTGKNRIQHAADHPPVVDAIRLEQVLADSHALDLFMVHMHHEYAPEALLATMELDQLQQYLETKCRQNLAHADQREQGLNQRTRHPTAAWNTKRGHALTSSVVLRSSALLDRRGKFEMLFEKYVEPGCDLEINISGPTRNMLNHAMARLSRPDFDNDAMCLAVHALQLAVGELKELLRHSLANFKNRNEFDAVVAALAPQPQKRDD